MWLMTLIWPWPLLDLMRVIARLFNVSMREEGRPIPWVAGLVGEVVEIHFLSHLLGGWYRVDLGQLKEMPYTSVSALSIYEYGSGHKGAPVFLPPGNKTGAPSWPDPYHVYSPFRLTKDTSKLVTPWGIFREGPMCTCLFWQCSPKFSKLTSISIGNFK